MLKDSNSEYKSLEGGDGPKHDQFQQQQQIPQTSPNNRGPAEDDLH